jgi:hypothetical protein
VGGDASTLLDLIAEPLDQITLPGLSAKRSLFPDMRCPLKFSVLSLTTVATRAQAFFIQSSKMKMRRFAMVGHNRLNIGLLDSTLTA